MLSELQSLKGHQPWELEPRSKAKKVKVITLQRDERGRVTRFKSRLVIHGFKQKRGVNYSETFAPVIRFETIRTAIYYAAHRGWLVLQYDVKTAFLYGELTEVIFIEQPPGFQESGPEVVGRLMKSLYGLKQAPHIWNKTLHAKLVVMVFVRMESDFGLYDLKVNDEVKMLLAVYFDHMLLMGPHEVCEETAAALRESFELTTMGM
ncbi:Retrotransposon Tca5 Polyprotein [Phytophthora palmivora]|uniref:Retrotransposon Tca5 Polyprotein n=1 Tax=Phytophthora palmivora TaxID=4796 RepID=A0A2P4X4M8_9STRA|nr:Retrotransposon Tca5 Polyprotein [Phytophthora palmivora]